MPRLGSGKAGTGDEWTGNLGGTNPGPVSTYFNLYATWARPSTSPTTGWSTARARSSRTRCRHDQSGNHGTGSPAYVGVGRRRALRPGTDPKYAYHLRWWQLPERRLTEGMYRLQVTTTKVDTSSGGVRSSDSP